MRSTLKGQPMKGATTPTAMLSQSRPLSPPHPGIKPFTTQRREDSIGRPPWIMPKSFRGFSILYNQSLNYKTIIKKGHPLSFF